MSVEQFESHVAPFCVLGHAYQSLHAKQHHIQAILLLSIMNQTTARRLCRFGLPVRRLNVL